MHIVRDIDATFMFIARLEKRAPSPSFLHRLFTVAEQTIITLRIESYSILLFYSVVAYRNGYIVDCFS